MGKGVFMGKQINYWKDYKSFLSVAQTAIDNGCYILKVAEGTIIAGNDISVVTEEIKQYYFYCPESEKTENKQKPDIKEIVSLSKELEHGTMIKADYSYIKDKRIIRNRIYVSSGYYNDLDQWIPRPDHITKMYQKIVRAVKKAAPYTELVDIRTHLDGEHYLEEYQYKHKEYVSLYCLELRNKQGYLLCE